MLRVRARVHHGRLLVDEPTELPEGAEVVLVAADASDVADDWSPELDAELVRRYREVESGTFETAEEVLAYLRAR